MLFSFQQKKHSSLFSKIHLTVNGKKIIGEQGETVRQLLINNQIQIPSLCNGHQTCELCKELVDNKPKLACSTQIKEGMVISTKSEAIKQDILQKLSKLPNSPTVENAIKMVQNDKYKPTYIDDTTNSIRVDYSKCIDCGTCLKNCGGGFLVKDGHIQAFGGFGLKAAGCTSCGKCAESCPAKAITYTDNIPLYKDALMNQRTARVIALDDSILFDLEDKFKLPKNSLKLHHLLCLLKNLGFDYFFDNTLLSDIGIINDVKQIEKDQSRGIKTTVGTSCVSLLKKILKTDPIRADQVTQVLLGENEKFTTFVVSGCFSIRGFSNIINKDGPQKYSSVGISPSEFLSIIQEKCGDSNIESLFNGSPCEALPLGSSEARMVISDEAFADFVARTYSSVFYGKEIKPLQFKKVDRLYEIANANLSENHIFKIAVTNRRKGFDKLMKKKLNDLIYILPVECYSSHSLDSNTIKRYMAAAETRKVKKAWENDAAWKAWKYLRQ